MSNHSEHSKFFLLFIGCLSLLGSVNASLISVTNTGTPTVVDTGPTSGTVASTISNWDLNGGNTVVLYFNGENSQGVTAKYGTQDMTIVEAAPTANRWVASIAYIINPDVSIADIDLNWTSTGDTENVFTALSLSNVSSVAATASTDSGNLNFNYTTDDFGFVVGGATNNDFNGPPGQPTVSGNPDTFLFSNSVSGNAGVIHSYGDIPTPGSYTDSYGLSEAVASVVFVAVPEPTTGMCLLGLISSACFLRRRRKVSTPE